MSPVDPRYATPLTLLMLARHELQLHDERHPRKRSRHARPAGRLRRSAAAVLVRAAARLAKEPVASLPRRA